VEVSKSEPRLNDVKSSKNANPVMAQIPLNRISFWIVLRVFVIRSSEVERKANATRSSFANEGMSMLLISAWDLSRFTTTEYRARIVFSQRHSCKVGESTNAIIPPITPAPRIPQAVYSAHKPSGLLIWTAVDESPRRARQMARTRSRSASIARLRSSRAAAPRFRKCSSSFCDELSTRPILAAAHPTTRGIETDATFVDRRSEL